MFFSVACCHSKYDFHVTCQVYKQQLASSSVDCETARWGNLFTVSCIRVPDPCPDSGPDNGPDHVLPDSGSDPDPFSVVFRIRNYSDLVKDW